MEIGSVYELNPALVEGSEDDRRTLEESGLSEIKKYGKRYCYYTASGREAIAFTLKSLAAKRPDLSKVCLFPAYMCDSVFFPFEREDWEIHFYHVNKELVADEARLRALIDKVRPSLLFIHPYYGIDTWKKLRPFLRELKAEGVRIMEDVTQSYYLEGVGLEADYVVGSLRKWYSVPDGGFAVSNEELLAKAAEEEREYICARLKTMTDKWEYLGGAYADEEKRSRKASYLKRHRRLEEDLDGYGGIRKISNETAYILKRLDEGNSKRVREENYAFLYERLMNKKRFAPILKRPEGEAAPLYLAVYADERDKLQTFLGAHDIYAPILWLVSKENEAVLNEDEKYIFGHILALPIDQRYGREEMCYIAEVMEKYEKWGNNKNDAAV